MIFYETKHRIIQSIKDIIEQISKNRYLVIAKEITKKWESIYGTTADNMLTWLKSDKNRYQKGEMIIILNGFQEIKNKNISEKIINTFKILKNSLSFKESILVTSQIYKIKKNKLYRYMLKNKEQ